MTSETSLRISRPKAGLMVIDIQERLLPAISNGQQVLQNAVRLIRGASVLGLPVVATEQYRKGLGPSVPEISAIFTLAPVEKMSFSACADGGLLARLRQGNVRDVIICGVEAHVCVCQTALDLLDHGFRVFVVADAIGSRASGNHGAALERMRAAGAQVVSTEMILFELLERAGTDEFKQILGLVK